MNVISAPFLSGTNPYLQLINTSLCNMGVTFTAAPKSFTQLADNITSDSIIHLHWPSRFYSHNDYEKMQARVEQFGNVMQAIRAQNGHLVWTAHNILPHEITHLDLEIKARKLLLKHCSAVIAHCQQAADIIADKFEFDKKHIHVIQHPDLSSCYSNVYSREGARQKLQLDKDAFIFVSIGKIRAYKGIANLINAFNNLSNPNVQLIIAGEAASDFDLCNIKCLTDKDHRIKTYFDALSNDTVAQLYCASNASVHNFTSILTSGSAILSIGLSRAVIAPRLGCLTELLDDNRGVLYEANNEASLLGALQYAVDADVDVIGERGKQFITQATPQAFATSLHGIYQSLLA